MSRVGAVRCSVSLERHWTQMQRSQTRSPAFSLLTPGMPCATASVPRRRPASTSCASGGQGTPGCVLVLCPPSNCQSVHTCHRSAQFKGEDPPAPKLPCRQGSKQVQLVCSRERRQLLEPGGELPFHTTQETNEAPVLCGSSFGAHRWYEGRTVCSWRATQGGGSWRGVMKTGQRGAELVSRGAARPPPACLLARADVALSAGPPDGLQGF